MTRRSLASALTVLPLATWASSPQRMPPRDDARGDAEFGRFRDRLRAAVRNKSLVELAEFVAEDLDVPMSGTRGREEFLRGWMGSESSWLELSSTLNLGAIRVPTGYGVPYLSWSPSGDTLGADPFCLVVIQRDALLRQAPDREAAVVERLRWDILHPVGTDWRLDGYDKVRSPKGRIGYVETKSVRSPIGERAIFERRDGKWKMTLICAGI